jgi:Nucleotidyltransferase of unknown function (DUF6036)
MARVRLFRTPNSYHAPTGRVSKGLPRSGGVGPSCPVFYASSILVIGALALGVWGTPRATYDVDFLILAQCDDPQPFLGLLRAAGFAINKTWHEANPMARDIVLRLAHPTAPHFPVDLVFSLGPFDRAVFDRRRAVDLHGLTIWMSSPEDLVLMKLRTSRPRDFDDVISIVKNPGLHLDLDYLWS